MLVRYGDVGGSGSRLHVHIPHAMGDEAKAAEPQNQHIMQPTWIQETLQGCLTDENIVEEVKSVLEAGEDLCITDLSELSDGHFNYVIKVKARDHPDSRTVVLKHSPPYARMFPIYPVTPMRSRVEFRALLKFHSIAPGCVPEPYGYNQDRHTVCMEDLSTYTLYRTSLVLGELDEDVARTLARNLATIHSHTHVHNIGQEELDMLDKEFDNTLSFNVYKRIFFDAPYQRDKLTVQYSDVILARADTMLQDDEHMKAVSDLHQVYLNTREALIHGDMHTSAVMIKGKDVKMIDLELARVGSCAKDLGQVLGSYFISYFYHLHHPDHTHPTHTRMVQQLPGICQATAEEYLDHLRLRNVDKDQYASQLLSEAAGYAAGEIIFRLQKTVQSEDTDTMQSGLLELLDTACRLMKAHRSVHSLADMMDVVLKRSS